MSGPEDDRAVTAAQRVVDGPAERVLEDRYTDLDDPGGGGGGGGPVIPTPYPQRVDPGLWQAPKDHPLAIALGVVSRQKAYAHLRLAVADLTDDPKRPVYAGYRDTEQTFVASMAKIAMLLPAYGLREAARAAAEATTARATTVRTGADFLKLLAKTWAGEFGRFNRGGKAVNTPPNLPRILSAARSKETDPFAVEFTTQQDEDWTRSGFVRRLLLALKYSDNDAAASCIRDLGFPYIHGVLKSAGIYDRNGLWLSLDFGGRVWDPSFGGSGQAATARSVAQLLALVAQDRLAAPGLAAEIHSVMSTSSGGAGSDLESGIRDRLPDSERATLTAQGKIGYLDAGPFADCAIIRRTSAKGARLAYVAVALGGASHDEIKKAGVALDDCVLLAHGEAVKPPANP
jgi:hypothetical protein